MTEITNVTTHTSDKNVPSAVAAVSTLTLEQFMDRALKFLDVRCVRGTAAAVSRIEVAKAGGLTETGDALISALISAGFMPGWKIRQGRDGGVCRVGETPVSGPNPNKYNGEWLDQLKEMLNLHVSTNPKLSTPRNEIARELAKVTGEDVLALPNKISEAISLGRCPGFESKRGSGIHRKEIAKDASTETLVVSADATSADVSVVEAVTAETDAEVISGVVIDVVTDPVVVTSDVMEMSSIEPTVSEVVSEVVSELATSDVVETSGESHCEVTTEAAEQEAPETTPESPKGKSGRKNRK